MDGVVFSPLGAPARDALFAAVASAKADDVFAPVTVVVPSNYTGLHLRRSLAAHGPGSVNVRFLTVARAAELLAAGAIAESGRIPRGAHFERAAAGAALEAHPGSFAAVGDHPAMIDRLLVALRELDRVPPGTAFRPAAGSVTADVLTIHRDFTRLLRDTYDDETMLTAAVEALASDAPETAALAELGRVIVYLPLELSPAADRFIARLLERDPHALAILGSTGDATVNAGTREFARRLGADVDTDPDATAERASIAHAVQAPDPDTEVREVVRRVRAITDDPDHPVPPASIAITYALDAPYGRIVQALLTEAALPFSAPSLLRLADSATGRTLLNLLTLPDDHFRRDSVLDLVASAPVREPATGRLAPSARWDRVSRAAGVVAGPEEWAMRLERYRAARAVAPGEEEPEHSEATHAARLATFVAELAAAVADPDDCTWTGWAQFATALLTTYVGRAGRSWPDVEIEAHDRVVERLRSLSELDGFVGAVGPVTRARFVDTLRAELAVTVGHTGRVGTGVFVAPMSALRGCTFHSVFVLGLADGRVPAGPQPDPLLPDFARAGLGLPEVRSRLARERQAFLAATAAATHTLTLSYARSDPRAAQALQPSPWIAPFVMPGATTGVAVPFDDIVSFTGAVASARSPASPDDLALQELMRWRSAGSDPLDHPTLATEGLRLGFGTIAARASDLLTEFDGRIGVSAEPEHDPLRNDRPQSATKLEQFATCPFRYFLATVLKLRAADAPERAEAIDPRERGTLVHEVLDRFFRARGDRVPAPGDAWDATALRELDDLAVDVIAEFGARGVLGRPTLWKFEERRVRRELRNALVADREIRKEYGSTPKLLEAGFGGDEPHSLPPVDVVVDDNTTVRFRGRIDRIDTTASGGAVVFDYKTGRYTPSKVDAHRVDGGRSLQLAIYGRAARAFAPSGEVDAAYWYTRQPPGKSLVAIPVDEKTDADLDEAITQIAGAIRAGTFPMVPGPEERNNDYKHCRACDFDRVCPANRARTWARKEADPALGPVHALFALRAKKEPDGSASGGAP